MDAEYDDLNVNARLDNVKSLPGVGEDIIELKKEMIKEMRTIGKIINVNWKKKKMAQDYNASN